MMFRQQGRMSPRARKALRRGPRPPVRPPRGQAGRAGAVAGAVPAGRTLVEWHELTPGQLAAEWAGLRAWVTWLRDRYELTVEERLPRCWALHPGLIEELTALRAWRSEIWSSGQPGTEAATGTATRADAKSTTAHDGVLGKRAGAVPSGRHRVHGDGQHGHQRGANRDGSPQSPAAPDHGDAWPPPKADQDRARVLYQHDFGPHAAASSAAAGRDRGTNVVGDKPDKSPGDTSDLPPTGGELLKMGEDKEPRPERLRDKFFDKLDDINDATKEQGETLRKLMDRPPPTGHPEVAVNSGPMIGPEMAQHVTVDVGSTAEVAMVLGVIGFQAGRWIEHKVEELLRR
jgi:hypothetical protein